VRFAGSRSGVSSIEIGRRVWAIERSRETIGTCRPSVGRGEGAMPKYLFEAKYTPEGVKGLKQAGAASRVAAVGEMCSQVGGSLESFHFAFGHVDAYVIVDLPDDEAAAAAAFTVGASAATQVTTIKLLTVEEADAAIARSVTYRPPGS
jgi:uncharacterized protein with GYD domain